jgi:hypothetical protein
MLHEIAGTIYRNFRLPGIVHYQFIPEGKPVNNEMCTDIIHRLTNVVRNNTLQNVETSVYFSRQCSSTPVGFGQGFLNKEQRYNTGSSPILS